MLELLLKHIWAGNEAQQQLVLEILETLATFIESGSFLEVGSRALRLNPPRISPPRGSPHRRDLCACLFVTSSAFRRPKGAGSKKRSRKKEEEQEEKLLETSWCYVTNQITRGLGVLGAFCVSVAQDAASSVSELYAHPPASGGFFNNSLGPTTEAKHQTGHLQLGLCPPGRAKG